jgi:hypothetical protein
MSQADAVGLRVDFVAIHYYWCYDPSNPSGAASQMYNFLKAVYDQTKRPIWITEWNNGADWTGCGDPTFAQQQACIASMVDMLERIHRSWSVTLLTTGLKTCAALSGTTVHSRLPA